jgi:hypothetical protein
MVHMSGIGSLNEKPLHSALKAWYARPADQFEVSVDGFVIDILRDELLIEIQTKSFSSMKRKLLRLIEEHRVRLIHPIAEKKWIVRMEADGETRLSRRKSPKHGCVAHVFQELVSFPQLLMHPNFSLEVLLIHEEELRIHDKRRGWRRKGWVIHERRLIDVVDRKVYDTPGDMSAFVPDSVPDPFTTADLSAATGMPRWLSQKAAYCLRVMGAIEAVGKHGNAICYATPA